MAICGTCQGSGEIVVRVVKPVPAPPVTKPCPSCGGTGQK
jgi:DnaJ-class molecular chaperone